MPRIDGETARFTVTLPKTVTDQLRAIADERGSKVATVMREAAFLYLKQRQRKRTSFREPADWTRHLERLGYVSRDAAREVGP